MKKAISLKNNVSIELHNKFWAGAIQHKFYDNRFHFGKERYLKDFMFINIWAPIGGYYENN